MIFQICAKNLADMYEIGQGTKPDAGKAYMWRSLMIDNYNSALDSGPSAWGYPLFIAEGVGSIKPYFLSLQFESDNFRERIETNSDFDYKKPEIELEKNKLNLLKNKMTVSEFKDALKMISSWKASHQR